MDLSQENSEQNSIISYSENDASIQSGKLGFPCFISKSFSATLDFHSIDLIEKNDIFPLITKDQVKIIIIGTSQSSFLKPEKILLFNELGLGVELMNVDAACRSFNLLLSDKRSVGLLII